MQNKKDATLAGGIFYLCEGLLKLNVDGAGSGGCIESLFSVTAAFKIAGAGSGGSDDGEVAFFALDGTAYAA